MSYIQQTKWGDCTRCPLTETECRKRGKDLVCLQCCKIEDTAKQVTKANERTKIRSLGYKQREAGNESGADRANVIQDLDYVASRIVRLREASANGFITCYTCEKLLHWSLADCSHFISRKCLQLRWDLKYNLKPACKKCNQQEYGNLKVFAEKLEQECKGIVEILREQEREVYKPDLQELKQTLIDLRNKLRPLEEKFKIVKTIK